MSIDEFIDKLAKHAPQKQWRLCSGIDAGGNRRVFTIRSGSECPISSFQDRVSTDFISAGRFLGLSNSDIKRILSAADDWGTEPELRKKLLIATGLSDA